MKRRLCILFVSVLAVIGLQFATVDPATAKPHKDKQSSKYQTSDPDSSTFRYGNW